MNRTQAIAHISATLAALDDDRVLAVAEIVDDIASDHAPLRQLTTRERALIEQSKDDCKAGRTYNLEEARAISDDFIKTLRTKYPAAPRGVFAFPRHFCVNSTN